MRREQKGKESTKSTFRRANRAAAAPERVHGVPETALHYVCRHIVKRETRFEVCVCFRKGSPTRTRMARVRKRRIFHIRTRILDKVSFYS